MLGQLCFKLCFKLHRHHHPQFLFIEQRLIQRCCLQPMAKVSTAMMHCQLSLSMATGCGGAGGQITTGNNPSVSNSTRCSAAISIPLLPAPRTRGDSAKHPDQSHQPHQRSCNSANCCMYPNKPRTMHASTTNAAPHTTIHFQV